MDLVCLGFLNLLCKINLGTPIKTYHVKCSRDWCQTCPWILDQQSKAVVTAAVWEHLTAAGTDRAGSAETRGFPVEFCSVTFLMSYNALRNWVDRLEAFVNQKGFLNFSCFLFFFPFPFPLPFCFLGFFYFKFKYQMNLCSKRKNGFLWIVPTKTYRWRPQGWGKHPGMGDGLFPGTD